MAGKGSNGPHGDGASQQQRSCYGSWFEDWWTWELLSVLGSIALTVGLCVLLMMYDGQPVPTFGSFFNSGITLATAVALLTTLAVALALVAISEGLSQLKWIWYSRGISRPLMDLDAYDKASRGSWGSVQLLGRLGASMPAGSLGALLMVVNLAVVPLSQQAVNTIIQSVPDLKDVNGARLPWTFYHNDRSGSFVSNIENHIYTSVGVGMKGAVLNGLFGNSETALEHVRPTCSSGNCTFNDYYSLAICVSRQDVTDRLRKQGSTGHCLPGGFCLESPGIKVPTGQESIDPFDPETSLATPAVVNITSAAPNDIGSDNDMFSSTDGDPLEYSSVAFPGRNNSIADFYLIYLNTTTDVIAFEVAFDWCVPKFSTNVSGGVATTVQHPDASIKFDVNIPDDGTFGQLETEVNGTHYNIPLDNHFSLQRWMQLALSGSVNKNSTADSLGSRDAVQALIDPLNLTELWDKPGLSTSVGTWDLTTLDRVLSNTAVSMSNFVRTNWFGRGALEQGDDKPLVNARHINGTVLASQPIVAVAWGWLAAPIAFVLLTTVFFLLVVIFGRRRPPVWKSSSLAVARSLDPDLQRALGIMAPGASQLTTSTQGVLVSLVAERGGWRLVANATAVEDHNGLLLHHMPPDKERAATVERPVMPHRASISVGPTGDMRPWP